MHQSQNQISNSLQILKNSQEHQNQKLTRTLSFLDQSSKFFVLQTPLIIISICFWTLDQKELPFSTVPTSSINGEFKFHALGAKASEPERINHLPQASTASV